MLKYTGRRSDNFCRITKEFRDGGGIYAGLAMRCLRERERDAAIKNMNRIGNFRAGMATDVVPRNCYIWPEQQRIQIVNFEKEVWIFVMSSRAGRMTTEPLYFKVARC